jgi:hypothetical protein
LKTSSSEPASAARKATPVFSVKKVAAKKHKEVSSS